MSNKMPVCSVTSCSNSIPHMVESTLYYCIPKDLPKASRWKNALKGHIGDTAIQEVLLCAKHFEVDAFLPISNKLKDTSIPTIFPCAAKEQNEPLCKKFNTSNISIDSEKKSNIFLLKQEVFKQMEDQEYFEEPSSTVIRESVFILEANPIHVKNEHFDEEEFEEDSLNIIDNIKEFVSVNEKNIQETDDADGTASLKKEIKRLKAVKENLMKRHTKLLKEEIALTQSLSTVNKTIRRKKKELKSFPQEHLWMLKKCLSPAQICHLIGKSRTKWSLDDLAMAYTISSLTSNDFYLYLRNDLKIPLPAVCNVNRCYKNMDRKNRDDERNEKCSYNELENDE